MRKVAGLVFVALVACPGKTPGPPAPGSPESIWEMAKARPVPDPLKGKFGIDIKSKPLDVAANTSGGLLLHRPGHGRLDLFGPFGGSVVTLASDGTGLTILLMTQKKQLKADDAEAVLREATGGVASIDDAWAILSGDLPFETAEVKSLERTSVDDPTHPDLVRARLLGPEKTALEVWLNPADATVRELVALDKKGDTVMSATYEPYQAVGDALMPSTVTVYVPAVDLRVVAKYKSWDVLEEPPAALVPTVPDGFVTSSLLEAVKALAAQRMPPKDDKRSEDGKPADPE